MKVLMWGHSEPHQIDSTLDLSACNLEEVDPSDEALQNVTSKRPRRKKPQSLDISDIGTDVGQKPLKVEAFEGQISSPTTSTETSKDLCHICGDRASGFHYNAFSCEGCKGFFRRSITRGATYVCKEGGKCEMDMWMRRRCQACRLRRCREAGMKEECLLSEDQCKVRDQRRKAKRFIATLSRQLSSPYPASCAPAAEQVSRTEDRSVDEQDSTQVCNPLEQLCDEHRQLIERLVTNQDKFELPSEESLETLPSMRFTEGAGIADVSDTIFRRMASMTILVTQLVVEVAKRLPGFLSLGKDDQIVLLKGSASEVMVLRTARRYDPSTDSVVFGDGVPFTRTTMKFGGLQDYVDDMFEFSRGMAMLGVDNSEYALLTAVCIFSDRPGLSDVRQVEDIQEVYVSTLIEYLKYRRPDVPNALARLLMKLVDLRTLSSQHGEVLKALKVEKGSLPPLLSEYFDLFD